MSDEAKWTTTDLVNHCRDCCCARSWKALGITGYTGQSIPEHIEKQRTALEEIRAILESPSWYDGDSAMETLLERLGFLVEQALPEAGVPAQWLSEPTPVAPEDDPKTFVKDNLP